MSPQKYDIITRIWFSMPNFITYCRIEFLGFQIAYFTLLTGNDVFLLSFYVFGIIFASSNVKLINRTVMKKIILTFILSLVMLPAFAQHYDNNHHNNHHHDVPSRHDGDHHHHGDHVVPAPMIRIASPEEVAIISNYIDGLMSSSSRLEAIKLCMQLAPMAAEDLAMIVNKITFDNDKLEALQFCYPLCPNKENYVVAIEQLTFQSNKEKLYKFIATYK